MRMSVLQVAQNQLVVNLCLLKLEKTQERMYSRSAEVKRGVEK